MPLRHSYSVWLKYSTFALLAIVAGIGLAALLKGNVSLSGRLISKNDGSIPFQRFDADRIREGVSLPADTNVIVSVPPDIEAISRITFLGGPDFNKKPYWGYCYYGGELESKAQGKSGVQLYPPDRFFYSLGELNNQRAKAAQPAPDLAGIVRYKNTISQPDIPVSYREILHGGDLCYVMSSVVLPVSIDNDGDGVNNMLEKLLGMDPNNTDTDGDGAPDGVEIFTMHTNPLSYDSDNDGLPDTLEDKNMNGVIDPGEASPNNPDSNSDGLCDGDGTASNCPERKYENAYKTDNCPETMPAAECKILPLIRGSDMNQNGKWELGEIDPSTPMTYPPLTNWQWKWEQLQKIGNGRSIRVP